MLSRLRKKTGASVDMNSAKKIDYDEFKVLMQKVSNSDAACL